MTRAVLNKPLLELQRFSRSFVKEANLTVIILLAVAMLSFPYFLKEEDLPLGKESYYHLRIAKKILDEKTLPKDDRLSYFGRENFMPLSFPFLIALVSFIFRLPVEIALNILLFLLGIISIILFYGILKDIDKNVRFLSCLALIISPIFVYLFVSSSKYTVPVVLSLSLVYFVLNKKYYKAAASFSLIPFFDLGSVIFIALAFLCYFLYMKRKKLLLIGVIILVFILSFIYPKDFNLNIISDLGAETGLSIFVLFLFITGIALFWSEKKFLFLYGVSFLLLILSLKFYFILFYLNFFLAIVISVGFIQLYNRKWETNLIKNLTLLLLVCGLLFSGVSYGKSISEDIPSKEFFKALSLLPDNTIIFSGVDNKHWINYANKRIAFDNESKDYNDILMLKDAEISRFLLDKYNISYILVDKKMRKDIWSNKVGGLLWVASYDIEHFNNIYNGEEISVWRYIRR